MFYKSLLVLVVVLSSFHAKAQSVNSAYLCMSDGSIVLADFDTCSVQDVVTQNNYLLGDIAEGDTPTSLYGVDYSNIYTIDLIAQDSKASDISQDIKDTLYTKAAEKIETLRQCQNSQPR